MAMHYSERRWKLAFTELFITLRHYKSFQPAHHLRSGLGRWDRRASELFNTGYLVEGAIPDRVLHDTVDQLHREMFNAG